MVATLLKCHCNVSMGAHDSPSHSRTVLPRDAEASLELSGENVREDCEMSVEASNVGTRHSRTVLSSDAERVLSHSQRMLMTRQAGMVLKVIM